MIKIAVCDDDEIYIYKILKPLLSRALKSVGVYGDLSFFTNGNLLLEEFKNHTNYNIVLLDIDMPSISGKELAAKLREVDSDFWLVFISAYKNEVFNVLKLNVTDFIPKEYDKSKSLEHLEDLLKKYISEKPYQKLFNTYENGKHATVKINLDDILYIKMVKAKVVLHTTSNDFLLDERTLKSLENELAPLGFYRIFSNIIVNVGKVYEVLENELTLNNGTRLPVSRRRRKELLTVLSRIISAKVAK